MFFKNHMSAEDTSRLRVFASHSKDWTVQQCPMLLQPPMINEIASVSFLLRARRLQRKSSFVHHGCMFAFEGGAAVAKKHFYVQDVGRGNYLASTFTQSYGVDHL